MALAAAVTVTLATGSRVAAQERPPGLLHKLDVQTLVARGDPADNDRLFAHFRTLWDRYLTDAKGHESMAHSVMGNPNRPSGGGASAYCTQLANLDRQTAETLRELALYHWQLAAGADATLPRDASRFLGGAGAPDPTAREFEALTVQAHTRMEHLILEEYLRTVATRHTRDANEHMMLARTYRGGRFAQAAVHHEHLAGVARKAARQASMAADRQRVYAALGR
jgi:hypothetical protein